MEVVCVSIIEEKKFAEKNVDDNTFLLFIKLYAFLLITVVQQMYALLLGQVVVKVG